MKKSKIILTTAVLTPLLATCVTGCSNALTSTNKSANETVVVGDFEYELNENTATLVKWHGSKPTGTLTISETITYSGSDYTVVAVGDKSFEYCSGLTEVSFPKSIKTIGKLAFNYCTNLKTITFEHSNCQLTKIDDSAFRSCRNLGNGGDVVKLPDSLVTIGAEAFYGCSSIQYLNSLTPLTKLTKIDQGAFAGCTNLKIVPEMSIIEYIGASAFKDCTALEGQTSSLNVFTIPSTLKFLGAYAFLNCNKLGTKGLHFEKKIYWSRLGSYETGAEVDTGAFKPILGEDLTNFNTWNEQFKSFNLIKYTPVTSINIQDLEGTKPSYDAWNKPVLCAKITPENATVAKSIKITSTDESKAKIDPETQIVEFQTHNITPEFVASADDGSDVSGSATLNVIQCAIARVEWVTQPTSYLPFNSQGQLSAKVIFNGAEREELKGIKYELVDPDGTGTTVNEDTGVITCGHLKSGTIKVKACSKILPTYFETDVASISVGSTIETDDRSIKGFIPAALANPSLITDEFPNGIVKLPAGYPYIAEDAFRNTASSTRCPLVVNGFDFSQTAADLYSIGNNAFAIDTDCETTDGWTGDLDIPGVSEIGDGAFSNRTKIQNVSLPSNLHSLGENAFKDCSGLKRVIFDLVDGISTIEAGTFQNCSSLSYVQLPANLSLIKQDAFSDCGLASVSSSVVFADSSADWEGRYTEYGREIVTILPTNPDESCYPAWILAEESSKTAFAKQTPSTTGITATRKTNPDRYTYEWDGSTTLENLVVPASIYDETTHENVPVCFKESAFENCTTLKTVQLSSCMTSLNDASTESKNLFKGCTELTSVDTLERIKFIPESAFEGCVKLGSDETSSIDLYAVQVVSKNAFKGCTTLNSSITFEDGLETIGESAFEGASPDLIQFYGNVASTMHGDTPDDPAIGDYAFKGAKFTHNLNFEGQLKKYAIYGKNAFEELGAEYEESGVYGCGIDFGFDTDDLVWYTDDTNATFKNAKIKWISCNLANVYNYSGDFVTDTLGGMMTQYLYEIRVPQGTVIDGSSFIIRDGWEHSVQPATEEEPAQDVYTKPA